MKKSKLIFLLLISFLVFSSFLAIPVVATVVFFASIPVTDPANDVFRFPGSTPGPSSITGDYRDDIDMLSIAIQGNNLTVEFAAPPQFITINYTIGIQIDNTSDDILEYNIQGLGNSFTMTRSMGMQYWDSASSSWVPGTSALYFSVNGNTLILIDIKVAIPELASCRVMAVTNCYVEIPTYNYMDYAPEQEPPGGGIPSFTLLFTLFSLIVLLGLVFHLRKYSIF